MNNFPAKVGSTLVSTVELLCQNPSLDEEFGETSEGFVRISLLRPAGPTRYVIQWKQRTQAMGYYDESQWITASVEADTFFKVKGLIPGVQYRFMVTAVGPTGRLGEPLTSAWTEISTNTAPKMPSQPITLRNGYNSDKGVTAHLEWQRTPQDSCFYKLQLSNASTQVTRDVTLDSSSSILLPHLEFDTDYSVTVAAMSSDKIQMSRPVTTGFKSLPCRDVHGRGSLQCAPEPATDLTVVVRPNGTGLVSWKPSADVQNILFYQIVYHAVSDEYDCSTQQEIVNIPAVTFTGHNCEYVVRLINYDLIGRDASSEVRVLIDSTVPFHFDIVFRPEFVLIAACVVLIPFACLLIRCHWRRCPRRVSEKQRKLTEYA
ncbi:unnamed protein product [Nippostrongylus brasiliensis]|uniref:Fibronectin type-III domain-containing protein n=1 Tax=Nippostrongylus brasiliensis TaxID=27835 RepID=A0A0N4YK10_NIPBR|nr:unnamed protein product [Nippostrongylus brasiliensis]